MLLEPELRGQLERLSLVARRRVKALWAGSHDSVRRGESLDFADYREYSPGDDYRRIDHNLRARLGVVLVRLFEAEEEMPLRVFLDVSESMRFGDKFKVALRTSAVMAYLGLAGGDRVQVFAVSESAAASPPVRHISSWPVLEKWLEGLTAGGNTNLSSSLKTVLGGQAIRGPSVVVSDLLVDDWSQSLDFMGVVGGGVVLQVLDQLELTPGYTGDVRLVDSESGQVVNVSMSDDALREYDETLSRYLEDVRGRSRRNGLDYLLIPAHQDPAFEIVAGLAATGAVR